MGAEKRTPIASDDRKARRGQALIRKASIPSRLATSQRREHSEPEQSKPNSVNDHQKTVSGKKQHGPDDKVGQDAGGNEGSKGQNVDSRRSTGTGKEPGDIGDNRGRSRGAAVTTALHVCEREDARGRRDQGEDCNQPRRSLRDPWITSWLDAVTDAARTDGWLATCARHIHQCFQT